MALADKIRAALDLAEENSDRLHWWDCDGLMGVGGVYGTCDCGEPDRQRRMIDAQRTILGLHVPTIKTRDAYDSRGLRTGEQRTDYHCGTCGGRDWDLDPIGDKPCDTLIAIARAYGVEV